MSSDEPRRSSRVRSQPDRLINAEVPEPTKRAVTRRKPKAGPANKRGRKTRKRTTRKKKDPNAPKRPSSAYMFFAKTMRPLIVKENPNLSFGDIGREVGAAWQETTKAQKKKYEAMAAKDKARYAKEMKSYKPPAQEESE